MTNYDTILSYMEMEKKIYNIEAEDGMSEKKKAENSYQETKKHGSRLFPFNIYPCTIPLDFPAVVLHWHKDMELVFVKKGKGKMQLGMDFYEGKEGDIFVIPPGTLHSIQRENNCTMEYENIIFEVDFLGSGAADICAGEYLVPLVSGQLLPPVRMRRDEKGYKEMEICLKQMELLCEKKEPGFELGVKAAALQLVFLLVCRYPERHHGISPDMEKLKMLLQQIEARAGEPVSVGEMAQFCGWSSSHFMRWFKNMTGSSFNAYVKDRRLAAAAEALRSTDHKIVTIAEDAGFGNLSNFNRQFKAKYGMTPGQYRVGNAVYRK